jgi:hypothetical protein
MSRCYAVVQSRKTIDAIANEWSVLDKQEPNCDVFENISIIVTNILKLKQHRVACEHVQHLLRNECKVCWLLAC